MGKVIVFVITALVFLAATLWVYAGVRHRRAALIAMLVGLTSLVSAGLVSSAAWSVGGTTNYRLSGIMGMGAGILLGGVCALFVGQRKSTG